jgi:PHD/YefM family antitoxin component YafN of YafNO toxin-antitoxin module
MLTKRGSATEAKNRLGALLADLSNGAGALVIEHHGRTRAVVVTAEEWAALGEARDELRRRKAWEEIWKIAANVGARNVDLPEDEADAIADELADEAKRRLALRLDS